MVNELIKQLLEAGIHFGHQTKRWNPKMKKFIFGERSGIYIIDLEKTAECLEKAKVFLKELAARGEIVLFVGTKKQAQDIIKSEALRASMYYINQRWLGGLLTNYQTIKKSINRLKSIKIMEEDGTFGNLKKKEVLGLKKEMEKLERNLSGIENMEKLPSAIFLIDSKKEDIAVKEAKILNIPIVALLDTNCNPDIIDYPIPGNDDAMKAIKLITTIISDSVIEGRKQFLSYLSKEGVTSELKKMGVDEQEFDKIEIPEEVVNEIEVLEESPKDKEGKKKPKTTKSKEN